MEDWIEEDGATVLFQPREDVKTCPRCGSKLFSDMEMCYECLYDFSKEDEQSPTEDYCEGEDVVAPEPAISVRIASRLLDVKVPLAPEGVVVGRSPECDVVLHDRAVSRRHVRVVPDGNGALVYDLSARNPARLNGKPVGDGSRMEFEDELLVCGTRLTLVP